MSDNDIASRKHTARSEETGQSNLEVSPWTWSNELGSGREFSAAARGAVAFVITAVAHVILIFWLSPHLMSIELHSSTDAPVRPLSVTFIQKRDRTDVLSENLRYAAPVTSPSFALSVHRPVIDRLFIDDSEPSQLATDDPAVAFAEATYMRQIQARIDRIWKRPGKFESSASDLKATCQVQIEQNDTGNVKEVLLQACPTSADWQESLVKAIWAASPLPAAPDPRVYSSSLVLQFDVQPLSGL